MTAPAAPLEKAVEEHRAALNSERNCRVGCVHLDEVLRTGDALLAALDADPWWSVWQKTYHSQREAEDRLEKAETLVRAIVSERHRCFIPTNIPEAPALMNWDERARRYFARREGKGERVL